MTQIISPSLWVIKITHETHNSRVCSANARSNKIAKCGSVYTTGLQKWQFWVLNDKCLISIIKCDCHFRKYIGVKRVYRSRPIQPKYDTAIGRPHSRLKVLFIIETLQWLKPIFFCFVKVACMCLCTHVWVCVHTFQSNAILDLMPYLFIFIWSQIIW